MKILLVGLGSIGQRHLRNLQALGVADISAFRVRNRPLQEPHLLEGVKVYTDLEEALAAGQDAVVICSPTGQHLATALVAAEHGCHLFIEKPISHAMDGVGDLLATVEAQGLCVLVGFQFRFHPGLRIIKRLLDEGTIAPVVCAHAHWGEYLPGWHPWEDYRDSYSARADVGGGVILTLCHPFDYLRWLLGEVRVVSAVAGRLSGLELDVEDTADITLQFESGAIGTVHLDYIQRPPSHWLQITGQTGTIHWDNADGAVLCYRADQGEWEKIAVPPSFERNTMFLDEMRHFLGCIAGRAEPLTNLKDGIQALEIALAAKRSAAAGRVIEV